METAIPRKIYRTLLQLSIVATDILLVLGVFFYFTSFLNLKDFENQILVNSGSLLALMALIQIAVFVILDIYKREITYLNFEELKKTLKSLMIGLFLNILFLETFSASFLFFKYLILSYFILTLLIVLFKYFYYWIYKNNYKKGKWVKNVLIFDVCPTGRLLMKKLNESPQFGFKPVGFIDEKRKPGSMVRSNSYETKVHLPVLGKIKDIGKLINKYQVNEIFIANPNINNKDLKIIKNISQKYSLSYKLIPSLLGKSLSRVFISYYGNIAVLEEKQKISQDLFNLVKRLFDLILATLAIAVFSPVFVLVAILIKRESGGPVFFVQKRAGKDGKVFKMYKFRTMKVSAAKYQKSPKDQTDKRITRLGAFLRRTSLDELPQFFNVVLGNMSIVGPRPEMPQIVKKYNSRQRQRLNIKPGITGIWQITADRNKPIHLNLDYDFYYIANQSILLDIIIMIRTVLFGIVGRRGV
ncbi:MAG: exopolysaccharide biosynthesis polyprenyl glycosylphosphotransferase [Candidatus Moranbacteria bacterium]|nr:exopolysaccharide biosynthesis polyprenyl glycosylphosphotransferase [Candidatus Moranbacteria bacterium]